MRIAIAIASVVAIGLLAGRFTFQPIARAQDGCTNATVQGAYGYGVNGFYYDQFGNQNVYAAVGRLVADGNGILSGTETASFDGSVGRNLKLTGTYSVNADCTGTASLKDSNGNSAGNFDIVVTTAGKEFHVVGYDQGTAFSGTAKQQ